MDPAVKAELTERVQKYFLEFLEKFRLDGQSEFYYIEQAKAMIREKKRTLYVKLSHLTMIEDAVSFPPEDLKNVIETMYMRVREPLNRAVPMLLDRIEDPDLQEDIQKARETEELKFVAAFYEMPYFSGIRDLRTEKLGRLVTICGTVTRTTDVKPELLVGTFKCEDCGREITGVDQQFKITFPTVCPMRNCNNRSRWTLLAESKTTRWGDWQRIRLQENENEVPAGSMPRSMDVIVRDECVERCKPGDKVMITGSLIVVPDVPSLMNPSELKTTSNQGGLNRKDETYNDGVKGLQGLGNRALNHKLAFFGCFIDENTDWNAKGGGKGGENVRSDETLYLTSADRERFQAISDHVGAGGKKDCFEVVAKSISPNIHGHVDVKKGILTMLIGGVAGKKTDEGIKLRGDINVCLVGDPATAKSSLLTWVSKFLPRAVFASGKTSTAAGLTASVIKDADLDGEKIIEPGALMLADNGICCIDEFELMDVKDMVAIHEAMEQQTITLSKAGIQATLNARASILAACLPKDVYYDATKPLHKNIELSAPIVSRFDLMFVLQDNRDETLDNQIAEHIVNEHRARFQGKTVENAAALSSEELQRYIRLARSFKPKITPEAREKLVRCYKKMREDRSYMRGQAGVTVRQLESLIRLSEAVARVHFDDLIRVEYVSEAFELQNNTLRNMEKGNIDLEDEAAAAEEAAPTPAPEAEAEEGADANAAQRRPRKTKITYNDYQRIGQMLARYLWECEEAQQEIKEVDLISWYMEQIEEEIQTEAQLFEAQHLVQLIINRLIDKDRVIVVVRPSDDPLRPEGRVLLKHPNFPIGDSVTSRVSKS